MPRYCALFLTLFLAGCLPAVAQDRSSPEATVRTFVAAFVAADMKQASSCVKGANLSPTMLDVLTTQIRKDPVLLTLSDLKTEMNGASATVTGQVTAKAPKSEKSETSSTQLKLVQSGESWQIIPDLARAQAANPDLLSGLAYMLTDSKIFSDANRSAKKAVCLSNLKQLGLGVLMYLQDWDDKFNLTPANFKKNVFPYTKSESLYRCPADSTAGISYSFNGNLTGLKSANLKLPASTVMIYEGKAGKLDFRHEGMAGVCFANGRAKMVTQAEAKKLRWKP